MTPAEQTRFDARRRQRNIALGVVLVVLVAIIFGITVSRMAG